jgi:putative SOS response-associated peptidase YedK
MCECIVQNVSSADFVAGLARVNAHDINTPPDTENEGLTSWPAPPPSDRQRVIKPKMNVIAIRKRDGVLENVTVRWGWSPVWAMGTMSPRSHLPLHLVMRSRVFDRVRREGRVLVAVDGWYELQSGDQFPRPRFNYTTSRKSPPIYLAALAQISETPNGCDGLVLLTHGAGGSNQQRMLAFSGDDALGWLQPDLQWEQAQDMALHAAVAEPQLEHVLPMRQMLHELR